MSDPTVRVAERVDLIAAETAEGLQGLQPRKDTSTDELGREVGAVLRTSDLTFDPNDVDFERRDDETMIINMGPGAPFHPRGAAAHARARRRVRAAHQAGHWLPAHRHGKDRRGAQLHPGRDQRDPHGLPEPDRQRALLLAWPSRSCSAIEVPERAIWIRMMMAELNRITSHLVWIATNGMDLGATSIMIYGFRERELILAFFEKTAGLRMNLNYVRPGGVAADLPDGWEDDVLVICDTIYERTFEYDELLTGQPIFRGRMVGVAPIAAEEALALGVTGPVLALDRRAVGPAPHDALPGL